MQHVGRYLLCHPPSFDRQICDITIIATYLAGHVLVHLEPIIQVAMSEVRQLLSGAAKQKQEVQVENEVKRR